MLAQVVLLCLLQHRERQVACNNGLVLVILTKDRPHAQLQRLAVEGEDACRRAQHETGMSGVC